MLGLPHDHNFDFLTLGYFGPGYWSDYYEYDYGEVTGWRGEAVPSLRRIERSRLEQGKLMLYRAHIDVHAQYAADALSVSLNIMHTTGAQGWLDQYRFDLERRRSGRLSRPAPARPSSSWRWRSAAARRWILPAALPGATPATGCGWRPGTRWPRESDAAARDALWCEAEAAGSRLVAMEARARRGALIEV